MPIGPSGEVVLSASRDGQLLATKRWYGKPGDPTVVPSVLFEEGGKEKLFIMTGFRAP